MPSEKSVFFRSTRGFLRGPGQNPKADGKQLVQQCLSSIGNTEAFPPRLLVLLATVSFKPFEDLLKGIKDELRCRSMNVPLVGCSVAGVFTEDGIALKGAVLVCFASSSISAKVGVAENVLTNLGPSVRTLREQLGLHKELEDFNPQGNQFLLCFLAGFKGEGDQKRYEAQDIHRAIRKEMRASIPMIGGVAADDFKRQSGWQFANDTVYTDSAVAALVCSDVRFGIGLAHGLEGTNEYIHVEDVEEQGHRILQFERNVEKGGEPFLERIIPQQVIEEYQAKNEKILFGGVVPDESERIVLFPVIDDVDGSAFVTQSVRNHLPVEILKCNPDRILMTRKKVVKHGLNKGHIDPFHLGCILGFSCAARYEYAQEIGLDLERIAADARQDYPGVTIGGGLMFGEIGLGHFGASVIRNWMAAALLVSDELAIRSMQRRGYTVLAEAGSEMAEQESLEDVLSVATGAIAKAGFPGGMISLVFRDRDSNVIVAVKAHGDGWGKVIPITRRRAYENDILNYVETMRSTVFIPDSKKDPRCDPKAVRISGVISQYMAPLIGLEGKVVGLLQVDLGDMSNLSEAEFPEYLQRILDAFSGPIAMAICRSVHIEELALSDLFDRAVTSSMAESTVTEASQEFVKTLVSEKNLLGADMIHIRLEDGCGDERTLRLTSGHGDYYKAARKEKPALPIIPATDESVSPTVKAFLNGQSEWVNDIKCDPPSKRYISSLSDKSHCKQVLSTWNSYANLMIRAGDNDQPIGVITIASKRPWFLSESRQRSLKTLGYRLFFALEHAERVQAERQRSAEVELLLKITPQLNTEVDLRSTLYSNAKRIARAAIADKVSFFLWDDEQDRLVLYGQHGWEEDMVGRATYKLGEGMTGTIAKMNEPIYISDLDKWKKELGQGVAKYEKEVFGKKLEDVRYEVIGIPLRFERLLGALVLQNAIESEDQVTKFATIDDTEDGLLTEISNDLSAFIYASLAYQERLEVLQQQKHNLHRLAYTGRIQAHLTHDLRNQLGIILAEVRTLVDTMTDSQERTRLSHLEIVCENLTSRMCDYLQAIERNDPPQQTLIDLTALLNNAVRRCSEKASDCNVNIDLCVPSRVFVKGTEQELEDAFFNIIDNGLNAMDKKGEMKIVARADTAKGRVQVAVTDHGNGIPKEDIPRILNGFYKSNSIDRPAMGLFLAKHVIEGHDGHLHIKSKQGKGTTVLTTLPCNAGRGVS